MGPRVWRKWPLNVIFVLIYFSANIGFQHGASVAAAERALSVDLEGERFNSKLLFFGRDLFESLIWTKSNVKVSQNTEPFLFEILQKERNSVNDGEKEGKNKRRYKRSYKDNQRQGDHEDKFQLSSSIPADFILVVVLGNPVRRASLFWLQHAFEKQLNLPLDNIGIFRTSYNVVELFFIKDGPPEPEEIFDNLIPAKDIMNSTLLHSIQQRAPSLNVTDIHLQHPLVISHYTSMFWMDSFFPYLAAAGSVAFVLLLTVMIYCCCKRRQKITITEKEPQQKQQKQQRQILYPTIAPNMKDPMMVQPEGSPVFVTKGCLTQVQTQTTRIKSKGLLERRGSNASLTLDLNASPEMNRWDGTPPKESSCLEYMLSAGNRLSRRDLRNSIKNNRALYQEFWEIPMNIPEKVHIAGSGMKNRYKTIIPNEFTRVILPDNEWDPLSSYINANYVRGYEGETRAYIATQGPMSHTIVDFWRMVWVEKSPIIVMITKLKEKNKPKCENYLPEDNKSCTFGKIEVKVDSVIVKGGYTLRHLYLKCNGEVQHVLHYWYTAWPDHKPPESPTMLLGLVKEVELHRCKGQGYRKTGPVIVHCSAGIGRTGCFIAISVGMRQLREEHSVDVLGTVCSLRLDRGGTIQTHEQYEFIHQALCEYEKELAEPVTNYNED